MRKAIRQFLRLDTWGMDIFRLKRRMGEVIQFQNNYESEVTESFQVVMHILDGLTDNILLLDHRIAVLEAEKSDLTGEVDSQPALPY